MGENGRKAVIAEERRASQKTEQKLFLLFFVLFNVIKIVLFLVRCSVLFIVVLT